MLRLLVGVLKPSTSQAFVRLSLKGVSSQQPLQFLRQPFFPLQNPSYQSWIRNYHRSTFLGKGQKDPKKDLKKDPKKDPKKGPNKGPKKARSQDSCAKDTSKFQKSSKNTLRPEDASSALHKARVCKPPTAPRPPPMRKKGVPPCPPKRTCAPREIVRPCGKPPPKPCKKYKEKSPKGKKAKKGKKGQKGPAPPPLRNAPQPTRTVLPRQMGGNYDMPPQQECPHEVSWPTRPVITRIRVCSPEEVRRMVQPKFKYIPCPEIYEVLTFKEKVVKFILFIFKVGLTTVLVWLTVDLGIWRNSDDTTDLLNSIRGLPEHEPPPRNCVLMFKIKQQYNRVVKNVFWILTNIPEVLRRVWRYIRSHDEEPFDVKLHDSQDVAP